jgi:hypothetical protein
MESLIADILRITHLTDLSTRKKEKYKTFEDTLLEPNELYKEWFLKRGYEKIRVEDFIEQLFTDEKTELDFKTRTISFKESLFMFEADVKIHIYEFFKKIPEIFIYT